MQYSEYKRTQDEIESALSKPLPGKLKKTFELINQYLIDLTPFVFQKTTFDKIIPFFRIYKIGKLSVVFIIDLVEVWS